MTNWILGEKFYETYPHQSGVKALWESKWKFPVGMKLPQQSIDCKSA